MAEVVFVLGAGASAEGGAPLMGNFLEVAEDLWLAGEVRPDAAHFERVFKSIAALKSVHAQLALDTYNLESVFSAFEMGAMVGRLGTVTDDAEIQATRDAMVRVIVRTLINKVRLPVVDRRVTPPWPYESFVALLRRIIQRPSRAVGGRTAPAVITLNYDLGLDYALHFGGLGFDYGTAEGRPAPQAVQLLKLHGSINWGSCPKCKVVVPWHLGDFFRTHHFNVMPFEDGRAQSFMLDIADQFQELKHGCGEAVSPVPVVVPPTWNKTDNQLVRNVWRNAARELSEARYIVFIGYSFPETDLYFRYLLALGLAGEARIRRIMVLNPDPKAPDQLRSMLSPNLQGRVQVYRDTFANGLDDLHEALELKGEGRE